MPNSLHIRGVCKHFPRGEHPALNEVSLDLGDGGITALVGESGSGKTTLLRIIAGLETPDRGEISIGGVTVCGDGRPPVPPERRHIGFVFQDHALFPHLTVRKNILYGLHPMHRRQRSARLAEIVELAGLDGLEARFPHELSGGQQQRVALARALAPKPPLILLDEPFSNLDPMRKDSLRDEVRRIVKSTDTAALIVTHDTSDALAVADTLAVLKEGHLQQVGTPERVYFHSSNEYTASLFGKVNRLPCQLFHEDSPDDSPDILVRPADMEICPDDGDGVVGKVIDSTFRGDFHEVTIEYRSGDTTLPLTIYVDPSRKLATGDTVTVRYNQRALSPPPDQGAG